MVETDPIADAGPSELASVVELPGAGLMDETGRVLRLDALEKNAIRAALRQTGGNRTQAAAALGISIRTLRNKLQEYRDAGDPADAGLDTADA